jgi:pimeloyl-ACP methyl ester carboxylesterase
LALLTSGDARAQAIDLLKIFVPAAPGGGWDQTARTIEQVLRATGAVKGVQTTNVGGAGGAVGLPQFLNQWKGQGNALMVGGMVMVGAIIANKSPVRLAQATPIARLTGEFLALVLPAQSPFKSAKDFAAALKADPLAELESYFRQMVVGGDPDAARWVLEDLHVTHEDAVLGALADAVRYEPLPALERYPGPRLSIISDMNRLPYSLHKLLPDLPVRLMTGTGHWLMMDRPEVFNHLLDEFVSVVETAGRT